MPSSQRFPTAVTRLLSLSFAAVALVALGLSLTRATAAEPTSDTMQVVARSPEQEKQLRTWISELREEAMERNVSSGTLDVALAEFEPMPKVIELDRNQPEFTMTFDDYLKRIVTRKRVEEGRKRLAQHRGLLNAIHDQYNVQPRFIVALWGLESNYGQRMGSYSVVHALATLAWDGRRAKFFRGELLDALTILEQGHVPPDRMLGSWAGAMGQPQFMPSSFRNFAVDHDGDSRADIWSSTPDVLASAANYLAKSGWRGDLIWGREVRLPKEFDLEATGRDKRKPLSEWQRLGVRRSDGSNLPRADVSAAVVLPGGEDGPAYLVYENYRVILRWNRSDYFATAVGILSDRIGGRN